MFLFFFFCLNGTLGREICLSGLKVRLNSVWMLMCRYDNRFHYTLHLALVLMIQTFIHGHMFTRKLELLWSTYHKLLYKIWSDAETVGFLKHQLVLNTMFWQKPLFMGDNHASVLLWKGKENSGKMNKTKGKILCRDVYGTISFKFGYGYSDN